MKFLLKMSVLSVLICVFLCAGCKNNFTGDQLTEQTDDLSVSLNAPRVLSDPVTAFTQINFHLDNTIHIIDSDWGVFHLTFSGSTDILYLNVVTNNVWSIKNVPVLSIEGSGVDQSLSFWFDLGVLVGTNVTQINYDYELTSSILTAAPSDMTSIPVDEEDFILYSGESDIELTSPGSATDVEGGAAANPNQNTHQDFPNQEAGIMECVPVAVSNSLQFLNNKHNLGLDPNSITIEKMKIATNWNGGCSPTSWMVYKDAYMKNNNLCIITEKVGLNGNDIQKIIDAIKAGKDVEMGGGGHTVAVIGITDLGNGRYAVTIAHDSQQGQTGGCVTETCIWDSNSGTWSGCSLVNTPPVYFVVEYPDSTCTQVPPTDPPEPTGPTDTPVPTGTPEPTTADTPTPVVTLPPTISPDDTFTPTPPPDDTSAPTTPPADSCTCVGLCDSRTLITVIPFIHDGTGDYCWESISLGTYVNSWNFNLININGVDCTNIYVASSTIPAISGIYYIYCNAIYAYSHFEIK